MFFKGEVEETTSTTCGFTTLFLVTNSSHSPKEASKSNPLYLYSKVFII